MKSRLSISILTLTLLIGSICLVKSISLSESYRETAFAFNRATGLNLPYFDRWIFYTIIAVVGAALVMGWRCARPLRLIDELGLNRPVLPALLFAVLASLPMLIGYSLAASASFSLLLIGIAAIFPFVEELLFRGFAFGQLCRRAGWGFWPAGLVTGLVFGLAHVPFNRLIALELGWNDFFTIALTGAGGVFFAWIYMKWNWNLWVPIFLHALMNAWWAIFVTEDGPAGGMLYANIFRALAITAAIVLTINRQRIPALRSRTS